MVLFKLVRGRVYQALQSACKQVKPIGSCDHLQEKVGRRVSSDIRPNQVADKGHRHSRASEAFRSIELSGRVSGTLISLICSENHLFRGVAADLMTSCETNGRVTRYAKNSGSTKEHTLGMCFSFVEPVVEGLPQILRTPYQG
jgi:hypothetical protein